MTHIPLLAAIGGTAAATAAAALLQSTALPTTVGEWLGVITQGIVIGGAVGGLLGKWLKGHLDGLSTRLGGELSTLRAKQDDTRADQHKVGARVEEMEKRLHKADIERANVVQSVGRLEGVVESLAHTVERHREMGEREMRQMNTTLTRIEERVAVFSDLKDDMLRIVTAVTGASDHPT